MDQPDDDAERQPLACVAVAAGLRGAGLAAVDRQPDDQPRDRGPTGVVGVEDLGEEQAGGHQGGVEALVEGDPFGGQGGLDHLGVEDVVEGEDIRLAEG